MCPLRKRECRFNEGFEGREIGSIYFRLFVGWEVYVCVLLSNYVCSVPRAQTIAATIKRVAVEVSSSRDS